VNTVTKEGGDAYHGQVSFYTGDHLSTRKATFFNIEQFKPLNNYVAEFTLGGPIPFLDKTVSFFASGRYDNDDGWLYGVREHQTGDQSDFNNPNNWRIQMTGDGAIVSMNPSKSFSATGKLTFKPYATLKINYDLLFSDSKYQVYSHDFKYNPDANYHYKDRGWMHALSATHTLNDRTFYTLKGSYNTNKFDQFLYDDPLDPRIQPTERLNRPTSATFYFGGTRNGRYHEKAETYTAKFDVTSQLSNEHEVKAGVEARLHTLDLDSYTILRDTLQYLTPTIPNVNSPDHNQYVRKPKQFAAYIQDKMEHESIIVNLGLRYDYFNPDAEYATDIFRPDGPREKASAKHQFSPRLGVSYPITDRGIIHFSYGHFFQMPSFANLYTNPEFETGLFLGQPVFGNANLNPEKTITYEVGLQQQLTDHLAFNITAFYKDVRDLLALEVTRISGEKVYQRFVNKDYGNIKGITFSLTKRRTRDDLLSVTLDYTFQVSEGNDVNADAFFIDLLSGRQNERTIVFLDWDQTHTLNATVAVGHFNDWNVSMIGRIGTGLPYTPFVTDNLIGLRRNSDRKPAQFSVDLLAEKEFSFSNYVFTLFLRVYNLLDNLNERIVYEDTGTAAYTLSEKRGAGSTVDRYVGVVPGVHSSDDYFNRPQYYREPREVRAGISIGF
jgi:outer membrane receptor protein involved in Fe transport